MVVEEPDEEVLVIGVQVLSQDDRVGGSELTQCAG